MTFDLPGLGRMLARTLGDPRGVAQEILAMRLDRGVLWPALLLVTILSVLLMGVFSGGRAFTMPISVDQAVALSPITYGLILGASLVLTVFAVQFAGRILGGTGDFEGALALVVWLEVVAIALRLVQAIAFLLSPALGAIVGIASFVVLLWCLVNFINALHGFDSLGRSVLTLVIAVVGIALGATLILSFVGAGTGGLANA